MQCCVSDWCASCVRARTESNDPLAKLGLPVARARVARSCDQCHGTGYRGRILLVEMLTLDTEEIGKGILARWDADRLEQAAVAAGIRTRWEGALQAVEQGLTSAAEVRRVLGFSDAFHTGRG